MSLLSIGPAIPAFTVRRSFTARSSFSQPLRAICERAGRQQSDAGRGVAAEGNLYRTTTLHTALAAFDGYVLMGSHGRGTRNRRPGPTPVSKTGLARANETCVASSRLIKEQSVDVENGEIVAYRVNMLVTFVLD